MPEVVIDTRSWCGYCTQAKALLARKGVESRGLEITGDDALRDEMVARSGGRRTVPQVFIGETHVGGCGDLYRPEGEGRLEELLA